MIGYCPMHSDEGLTGEFVSDELGERFEFECTRKGHPGGGPYFFSLVPERPGLEALDSIAKDLGLALELPAVVGQFKGMWVEYGVVERAYALARPADWAYLVQAHGGHRAIAKSDKTVSRYLAGVLRRLSLARSIAYHPGPATGRWSYLTNGVSWWSIDPEIPWDEVHRLSWKDSGNTVEYVPGQTEI